MRRVRCVCRFDSSANYVRGRKGAFQHNTAPCWRGKGNEGKNEGRTRKRPRQDHRKVGFSRMVPRIQGEFAAKVGL